MNVVYSWNGMVMNYQYLHFHEKKKINNKKILLVFLLFLKNKNAKKNLFSSFLFLHTCLG